MNTYLIHHIGHWGTACIDVQRAASPLDAACLHRRYFSGRILSVRAI
jgi:phosphatidylserine decarboxylase